MREGHGIFLLGVGILLAVALGYLILYLGARRRGLLTFGATLTYAPHGSRYEATVSYESSLLGRWSRVAFWPALLAESSIREDTDWILSDAERKRTVRTMELLVEWMETPDPRPPLGDLLAEWR